MSALKPKISLRPLPDLNVIKMYLVGILRTDHDSRTGIWERNPD